MADSDIGWIFVLGAVALAILILSGKLGTLFPNRATSGPSSSTVQGSPTDTTLGFSISTDGIPVTER